MRKATICVAVHCLVNEINRLDLTHCIVRGFPNKIKVHEVPPGRPSA
jgi:hypothetical protein